MAVVSRPWKLATAGTGTPRRAKSSAAKPPNRNRSRRYLACLHPPRPVKPCRPLRRGADRIRLLPELRPCDGNNISMQGLTIAIHIRFQCKMTQLRKPATMTPDLRPMPSASWTTRIARPLAFFVGGNISRRDRQPSLLTHRALAQPINHRQVGGLGGFVRSSIIASLH